MFGIDYIKFKRVVKKRNIYWNILFDARKNKTLTMPLVDEYTTKISNCDNIILRTKTRFGYRIFEKVY